MGCDDAVVHTIRQHDLTEREIRITGTVDYNSNMFWDHVNSIDTHGFEALVSKIVSLRECDTAFAALGIPKTSGSLTAMKIAFAME